ncbi:hypothetical protein ILYODFUR_020414 [Ilyodon furcidens]|uniref:Uncharacterized protein n=1 Tax=Ilyodon furcidens TaxID=33524 RepID=A0ABV0U8A0_9TELE
MRSPERHVGNGNKSSFSAGFIVPGDIRAAASVEVCMFNCPTKMDDSNKTKQNKIKTKFRWMAGRLRPQRPSIRRRSLGDLLQLRRLSGALKICAGALEALKMEAVRLRSPPKQEQKHKGAPLKQEMIMSEPGV